MDLDEDLSRIEKERIIQKHIETISENMLKNEEKLPDFVRNSYCFKKKKKVIPSNMLTNYLSRAVPKK